MVIERREEVIDYYSEWPVGVRGHGIIRVTFYVLRGAPLPNLNFNIYIILYLEQRYISNTLLQTHYNDTCYKVLDETENQLLNGTIRRVVSLPYPAPSYLTRRISVGD